MRATSARAQRIIAGCLCILMLLPFLPRRAAAKDGPKITIHIGQPSIWSLGQAHYLLARMHKRNNQLRSRFPDEEALDPNKVTATRIDALRSSLSVEGQFDQAMAVKNQMALRNFRDTEVRREQSRADLRARQNELQQRNDQLAALNEQIAVLQEEDRQSAEARARSTPPAPPSDKDNERKIEIVRLLAQKTQKEQERDDLKGQITTLTTNANAAPAAPELQEPALTSQNSLPNPDSFKDFMKKALEEAGKPDLSAEMKLNNFIQMQYDIIANQLTLLRDEVGPDDRIIFLELPADIYSVDKKADDYVAQVNWTVDQFYDKEPPAAVQEAVVRQKLADEGKSGEQIDRVVNKIAAVRESQLETKRATLAALHGATKASIDAGVEQERKDLQREYGDARPYPITLDMIKAATAAPYNVGSTAANTEKVRAVDIIPRQSALNVNEDHATVKQTMILAAFKFLVGFAGKVDYQRQRELYEQFVQQEVFASGFGKGENRFGWTYGPQPGTKRIAPGQRTTFAVLVVPRNTLAVELTARGKFYKRDKSPDDPDEGEGKDVIPSPDPPAHYLLAVPGERTQEFWVDGISYTPVAKGKRVTTIVEGDFFSPQLGVLVNGVPLDPVLSVARISGEDEKTTDGADAVRGEYEITNTKQIALSFSMGDSYVGTPTITFVSPEKTTGLNLFDLKINFRPDLESLNDHSVREPMFTDAFSLKKELETIDTRTVPKLTAAGAPLIGADGNPVTLTYRLARLRGEGLRPHAQIAVNDTDIADTIPYESVSDVRARIAAHPSDEFIMQDSTKSYILYFLDPGGDERLVKYRQLTKQGYEEDEFTEKLGKPAFKLEVVHYSFNPATRLAEVHLNFFSKGKAVGRVSVVDVAGRSCASPLPMGNDTYRVKCFVPAGNGGKLERDFITLEVTFDDGTRKYIDVTLPVRPLVLSVVNPRTGGAAGFVEEAPTVVISGVNLQGVTSVFFGDKEVKVEQPSPDAIAVKVPKGPSVAKGQAAAVPVVLQTGGGQIPTGAVYTYLGEPPTPNVIVWPFSSPPKQP